MNPVEKSVKQARVHLNYFSGGWPKGYIYDQNDPSRIIVDKSLCTGCVAGTTYQAMTGHVGVYDTIFYEAAKKELDNHPEEDGGGIRFTLQAAINYHRRVYCAGDPDIGSYHRLVNISQVISWIMTQGPVPMGLHLRDGFINPRPKKWWHLFGSRWATYDGTFARSKHAMTLTGVSVPGRYFRVQNSWGPTWGTKGTARLSFDDFERIRADRAVFYGLCLDRNDI